VLEIADHNDEAFRRKVNDQIKIVNQKLFPKRQELQNLLNRILQREHAITKRISNTNFMNSSYSSEGNTTFNKTFSKEFEYILLTQIKASIGRS
jgi:hypothetical protein